MFAIFTATYKLRQVLEYWLKNEGTHIHLHKYKITEKKICEWYCVFNRLNFFKLKKSLHSLLFDGFTAFFLFFTQL